jgi:hypothetical protein
MGAAFGTRAPFGMTVAVGTKVAVGMMVSKDAPPHAPELRMKDVRRR